jgi:hypothetical protein
VIGTLISLLKAKAMISLKEEIEQITLEAETATYLCLTAVLSFSHFDWHCSTHVLGKPKDLVKSSRSAI